MVAAWVCAARVEDAEVHGGGVSGGHVGGDVAFALGVGGGGCEGGGEEGEEEGEDGEHVSWVGGERVELDCRGRGKVIAEKTLSNDGWGRFSGIFCLEKSKWLMLNDMVKSYAMISGKFIIYILDKKNTYYLW